MSTLTPLAVTRALSVAAAVSFGSTVSMAQSTVPTADAASVAASQPADSSTPADAAVCPVQIYRMATTYNRANPEMPYVYADEQKVSRLGVGKTVCLKLIPGKHTVSMREPLVFMPGPTSGSIELEVIEGQTIYLRYAKELAGVTVTGAGAVLNSRNSLRLATQEEWKARQ